MDNYYEVDRLSYSQLASFDRVGLSFFKEERKVDSSAVNIGSLVDDILTEPESIKDKYFIITHNKPTASLGILADEVTSRLKEDEVSIESVYTIAKELNLWASVKKEDVYVSKFNINEFWDYVKAVYIKGSRITVSLEQLELAKRMATTLKNDVDTKDTFLESDSVEIKYQEAILWGTPQVDDSAMFDTAPTTSFKGFKSKFDVIRIDHENKTLQFVDIKTMEAPIDTFVKSFYMFRYYIQDAMYQDALVEYRDRHYVDYTLLDPYNIVISQADPDKAYKFEIDENWLIAGKFGFNMGYKRFKGYRELADEMIWHKDTGVINYTMSEFKNGKVKRIEFNGELE